MLLRRSHSTDTVLGWDWRVALGLFSLAVVARGIPAALFYGTSDVLAWELLGQLLLNGENFYATRLHNWPPLWVYLPAGLWLLHTATDLPFAFLVKLPPIAADACITVLLYRTGLRLNWGGPTAAAIGLAYALNPVAVLISGYHGQFDSLMLAPAVLAWYGWEFWSGRRRLLGSGLALGLGVWFKTVPLLFLPVFLPRLASWRERLIYSALAVGPAVLGTLPYLFLWPADVIENFVGYSSWFGQWGYPVVWMLVEFVQLSRVPWPVPDPNFISPSLRLMLDHGRWLLAGALLATWWYSYRRAFDVLAAILATLTVFYFATVGFGLQYVLWIVPFALVARERWLWPYTLAATTLLLLAYVMGPDAYLPPAIEWPTMRLHLREFIVKLASLPVWLICGLWAVSLLRRGRQAHSLSLWERVGVRASRSHAQP
jgi:hypothetical protein